MNAAKAYLGVALGLPDLYRLVFVMVADVNVVVVEDIMLSQVSVFSVNVEVKISSVVPVLHVDVRG